jgi:beta-mannosidase
VLTIAEPSGAVFREAGMDDAAWMPGHVPGSVHTDLLALDKIPDPFVADHELEVQWVAERDWEYQIFFDLDAALLSEQRLFLVCEGLDTLADVQFNGHLLGHTDNMFRRYRWEVGQAASEGRNTVHVVFPSTVAYMLARQAEQPLIGPSQSIPGGAHVRKAPCQFGWDWGPQLPSIGIWRAMRLEAYTAAKLDDVHVRQAHSEEGVHLSAAVAVERWADVDLTLVLKTTAPNGVVHERRVELAAGQGSAMLSLLIEDPELWWPNGLGGQPLYDVQVLLYQGEVLRDQACLKVGLRTLALRQEPDAYGTSFTFVVNGVPIFAKGANWIPADSFPTQLTMDRLEHLIASAAAANMNMLRVWGGGYYEDDRFYDLCDRYGLLVWQDFIFSCSVYPGDEAFVENTRREIVQNIQRLRHHPSLALWCGNNEMEWGWVGWGWTERVAPEFKAYYDEMFHELLPDLCAEHDPDRPYWPSSPSSGTPFVEPGGVHAGDTHNWEVWHGGYPFEHYRNHPSRFVSEFGFQSLPPLETIRTYADEQDWNMTSYMMEHHQRNAAGNGKIITYMTAHFRLPKDFPSLVYLTQLLQAEAVRTGVAYWRRSMDCTGGALYWQLNDCWPVASWASLDYYGRWKALHYAARRFFAPVLLTAEKRAHEIGSPTTTHETGYLFQPKPGPFVDLYVANDHPEAWSGSVRWSLETLEGRVLAAGDQPVTVAAVTALSVTDLNFEGLVTPSNERDVVLVYELVDSEGVLSRDILTFVPSKHLSLSDPGLTYAVSETDAGFEIEIYAEKLARFVWLSLDEADAGAVVFTDNYFDLPAGRSATVGLSSVGDVLGGLPSDWDPEAVRDKLRIRSLVESY